MNYCCNCPYYIDAPIVAANYSGYCSKYQDAVDNVIDSGCCTGK